MRIDGHKESFSGSILFKRCCWHSIMGLELRTIIICFPVATFLLLVSGSFGATTLTSVVGEAARSVIHRWKNLKSSTTDENQLRSAKQVII